jgi:hypothetical protein
MVLEQELDSLALEVASTLAGLDDPDLPVAEMGDLCLEAEENLSCIGIILLLTRGNSDGFLHNLIRAGRVWALFLERCRSRQATNDHNYCSGLFAPFIDALAARDWALAARLAALGPSAYREGHEHEDDYCYAQALHGLVTGSLATAEIANFLTRCAEEGDDMGKARASLGQALLARDNEGMGSAFLDLLQARRVQIVEAESRTQIAGPQVVAHRRVFIEGIALLNLAERLGIAVEADYPMCPSLSRIPVSSLLGPDGFA